MERHRLQRAVRTSCATAAAAMMGLPAHATSFELGDWEGTWNNLFSVGAAWRARDRDPRLYGQANGALVGLTDGTGANTIDEGELNYDKWQRFTTPFKLISEVELKKGDLGFFLRGKAWYDEALENEKVRYGNQGNGYNGYTLSNTPNGAPGQLKIGSGTLSDSGFEKLNKFSGVYLLDAYAYDTFDVGGQSLQVRAGNQVINWGESLYVQGLNQINPIDVPSFRKPGAQLKEVFLPVLALQLSQSLGQYGGLEAFWQAQWKNTPIEASCGNYWSVANDNITWKNPGKCNNAVTLTQSNPYGAAVNAYVQGIEGRKGSDSGEFGLAYRFSSDALDTEFGLYGMQINSRTPDISVQRGGTTLSPFQVFWEYPNNIQIYGVSASTNIKGWSVAGELSFHHDVPVQVDGNDLLLASLAAGGALAPMGLPAGTPFGPYGNAAVAAFAGNGYLPGYKRANLTQLQFNTVKAGNGILGAGQYVFVAEAAFQFNDLPDYKSDPNAVRFNRPFIFGPGSNALYGGNTCTLGLNISPQGCDNDGYTSRTAGGYRAKLELTYTDVLPGITMYPAMFISHDLYGYSLDNQFIKGRMALVPSLRFSYAKRYTFETGLVRYNRNAKYDPLRDRDFVYANATVSF